MSTEELPWRSCSILFALPSVHRQVNPAGHTVQLAALKLLYAAKRGIQSYNQRHQVKNIILA